MSEILSNIVVDQNNINFTPTNNNINVTPEAIQLNIYTSSSPGAGQSNNGELLYNNVNLVDGVPFTSYANGKLTLGSTSNIKITGGANAYFLQTDGTGNLSWAQGTANVSGNGTAAGANTQIQISDGTGNFTSAAGFTFDSASNVLSAPGNGSFGGNVSANYFIGNGSQLTGLITSSISNANSNVSIPSANGNVNISVANTANVVTISSTDITANANLIAGNSVTANYFIGSGANLSNIAGGNVTGQVGNALIAGTVYTNAQPNITSVGTLSSLAVTGNVTAGNVTGANLVSANYITGTLTTNAQPNITSVGTLTSLNVNGNITGTRLISNVANGTAPLIVTSQTLVSNLFVSKSNISDYSYTNSVGSTNASFYLTFVAGDGPPDYQQLRTKGALSYNPNTAVVSMPIANVQVLNVSIDANIANANLSNATGSFNGTVTTSNLTVTSNSIRIGSNTGSSQGTNAVAIGTNAGANSQGNVAVAIGNAAGQTSQGVGAVAIGWEAGQANGQGTSAVAVGQNAGSDNQGNEAVAIGMDAGDISQGAGSVAIGPRAGRTNQAQNSIVINATASNLEANTANALFIKPVRTVNSISGLNALYYDSTTGEIVVYVP